MWFFAQNKLEKNNNLKLLCVKFSQQLSFSLPFSQKYIAVAFIVGMYHVDHVADGYNVNLLISAKARGGNMNMF